MFQEVAADNPMFCQLHGQCNFFKQRLIHSLYDTVKQKSPLSINFMFHVTKSRDRNVKYKL